MLTHNKLRDITISTHLGDVTLNNNGQAENLKDEDEKELGKLNGFTYVDEKKAEKEKEKAKKVEKEMEKADKEKTEEARKERLEEGVEVEDGVEDP